MKLFAKSSLIALCALAPAAAVMAQDAPQTPEQQAEQVVLTRQGLLKVMGHYMAPLGAMLKNKMPFDAATAGFARRAGIVYVESTGEKRC